MRAFEEKVGRNVEDDDVAAPDASPKLLQLSTVWPFVARVVPEVNACWFASNQMFRLEPPPEVPTPPGPV